MKLGLEGKTVVVTGGTSGIGKTMALHFLDEGCNVAVCGRNKEKIKSMEEYAEGKSLFISRTDVTSMDELNSFGNAVLERFGRVDIWVNNAGLSDPMPFEEANEEAFDRMIKINLKAVFFGSQIAARLLRVTNEKKNEKGGVIINTSSFTSFIPTAGKALYSATKAAVSNLTQTLAAELAADNIRVVSVVPGYITTGMTAQNISLNKDWLVSNITSKRLGTTDDLADAYVFLASDAASYITGTELKVAGGKLCVQNPMWSWERNTK